jgi:hypothetical protein
MKAKILPSQDCQPKDSFLVVYRNVTKSALFQELDIMTVSRVKRDVEKRDFGKEISEETNTSTKDTGCRLVPWMVDFEKLEWDKFIVYPKTYMANACEGHCTPTGIPRHTLLSNKTSYEILRVLYGEKPDENCCKPSKFGSQSLLFYGEHNTMVVRTVSNMRVLECKCS